jgi:hypothetical protein
MNYEVFTSYPRKRRGFGHASIYWWELFRFYRSKRFQSTERSKVFQPPFRIINQIVQTLDEVPLCQAPTELETFHSLNVAVVLTPKIGHQAFPPSFNESALFKERVKR